MFAAHLTKLIMDIRNKAIAIATGIAVGGFLTSCETQDLDKVGDQGMAAQKREQSVTSNEIKANNYRKAAKILADLLKEDKSFLKKVKEGMKVSRPGQENVSFKELTDESSKISEIAIGAANFKKKFKDLEKERKAKDKDFTPKSGTEEDLLAALIEDGAQVYFPYSEVFTGEIANVTVAFDPVDNADTSTGYYYSSGDQMKEVTVDDDYAYANPTFIVMEDDTTPTNDDNDPNDPGVYEPETPVRTAAIGDTVTEIYVGGVRLKENLDGIFDGNNEVRFVRSDTYVYLDATGRPVSGANGYVIKAADVSRVNARDKNWVIKNILFDSDWIRTKTSQHFALYEHDPNKTRTLKTNTGVSIPVTGGPTYTASVENTLSYSTDHQLAGSQVFYRGSFMNTNTIPTLGGTLKDGYRLYVDGPFEYTLPHRVLIFP